VSGCDHSHGAAPRKHRHCKLISVERRSHVSFAAIWCVGQRAIFPPPSVKRDKGVLCRAACTVAPHAAATAAPPWIVISYKIRSLTFWSAFGLWFTFAPVLVRARSGGSSRWERFGAGGGVGRCLCLLHSAGPSPSLGVVGGCGYMGNAGHER
jgi:hypothetical protein